MNCSEALPLIEQRPLGLLDEAQTDALLDHLAACADCRAEAAVIDAVHAELSTQGDPMTLPTSLRDRVVDAMDAVYTDEALAAKQKGLIVAEVDPAAVEAAAAKISLACSYCHDRTQRAELVFCASCLAPHHADCFAEHGRCSLPGCGETLSVRPGRASGAPARRRRWRGAAFVIGFVGLGAAALAMRSAQFNAERNAQLAYVSKQKIEAERALEKALAEREPEEAPRAPNSLDLSTSPDRDPAERLTQMLEAIADRSEPKPKVPLVSLDAAAPMRAVCAQLAQVAERTIVVDDSAAERMVTLALSNMPWDRALDLAAVNAGCRVEASAGGMLTVTRPRTVNLKLVRGSLPEVLKQLGGFSGKNLMLSPDVQGQVTVCLEEVFWDEALLSICDAFSLQTGVLGEVLLVTTGGLPEGARPLLYTTSDWVQRDVVADANGNLVAFKRFDLQAEGMRVQTIVEEIQRHAPVRLLLKSNADHRVSLALEAVTWDDALSQLCKAAELWRDDHYEVVHLRSKEPNLLVARDVSTHEWFSSLAEVAGVNLVIPGKVGGRIDAELRNVSYRDALVATATTVGLRVERMRPGLYRLIGSTHQAKSKSQAPELVLESANGAFDIWGLQAVQITPQRKRVFFLYDGIMRSYDLGGTLTNHSDDWGFAGVTVTAIEGKRVTITDARGDEPKVHVLELE